MKRLFTNVGLTVMTLIVMLLVSEGIVRLIGLKTSAVASGLSRLIQHDPLLGWSLKPGSQTILAHPRYSVPVRINRHGLRGGEFHYQKVEGRKRIVLLGDSFAWGWGVNMKDSLSQSLERKLKGVEVINAAVPGYSTDQELLWLEKEGHELNPDLVILFLYGNDVEENDLDSVYLLQKPRFVLENDGSLKLINVPCSKKYLTIQSFLILLLNRSHLAKLIAHAVHRLMIYNPTPAHQPMEKLERQHERTTVSSLERVNAATIGKKRSSVKRGDSGQKRIAHEAKVNYQVRLGLALIERMRQQAEVHGARFLVVSHCGEHVPCLNVRALLKNDHFPLIELNEDNGFRYNKMTIRNDGHWNIVGHEFAAQAISNFLKKNHFLN